MDKPKILFLTIKKKWFDQIAKRKKIFEYREIKPYWTSRLFSKNESGMYDKIRPYTEVHFRNGYSKESPFMRVGFKAVWVTFDKKYSIELGEILEIRNWPK